MRSVPPRDSGWVDFRFPIANRFIGRRQSEIGKIDNRQSSDPPATAWWY